jgi:hypothetical protein
MSGRHPNAIVTTPSGPLRADEAALLRVRVSLGCTGAHDLAELIAWPSSKLAALAVGDVISIALGERDAETDVFTGEVSDVLAGADGVVIEALAATSALSRTRRNQTYLGQSIAEIVRDLASDVDTADVQGDLTLDAYAVDDRRPVWEHLIDLAELAGADLGCSAEGGFRFVPVKTGAAQISLRYGADLLAWSFGPARTGTAPAVAAQGAASEQGADKWHWIARTPTGKGDGPLRVLAALRTTDAAESVSTAWTQRAARAALRGSLSIVGRPEPRPGDLVELAELPDAPGTLRLLGVEHLLDARTGFVTQLRVESGGDGGLGSLLGGLL